MHLQELKLTNFKNYEFQSLVFSERMNLISGLNGMGKTNLLDAVYYLCMGKSHFQGTDKNVVRKGEEFFRLEGRFLREKSEKIVAKVIPGKQKTIERNDTAYPRISDHVGLLPVVFMAPDDTALALDGSEERRRFIDNTLCQIDHRYLDELVSYNKILEKRNALLRQFSERGGYNPLLLEAYNQQLLAPAAYIFEQRSLFAVRFQPVFNEYYQAICGGAEPVDCSYRSQLDGADFLTLLESSADKDRILQRTTTGIHKDDLIFHLRDLPLKRFASQGQLKSFVLALKLAQYHHLRQEKTQPPILLLDDLFDKLDDRRAGQLIELLVKGGFGQVFITDTHPERAEEMAKKFEGEYRKFVIENGAVN
ncbi:MAG: DNA replication and repair protein RecF [Bacteroidetes bacterium]|nr:DNA replication and repair protein RecF [Bacteroidota bacterium]